jgi:hypothetical protein
MPIRTASLFWTASLVYRAFGATNEADSFLQQAKVLVPRIDTDEPIAVRRDAGT